MCGPISGGERGLDDYMLKAVTGRALVAGLPVLPPICSPLSCADADVGEGTVALDHLPLVAGHFLEVDITVTEHQKGHSLASSFWGRSRHPCHGSLLSWELAGSGILFVA